MSKTKRIKKEKKRVWLAVVILVIALSIGVYYIYANLKTKEIINKILENPDEYNTPLFLRSLTAGQQRQLLISMDELLFDKCGGGRIWGDCTRYFLLSYMQMKINLGVRLGVMAYSEQPAYSKLLKTIYSDFRSQYKTLTENDLKGFTIPIVTSFCRINLINNIERISWLDNVINVNKTSSQATDVQIFYAINCFSSNRTIDIKDLSNVTGKALEQLKSKICNNLPSVSDANNVCLVFDSLDAKRFCAISLVEDKALMGNLLSKQYSTNYQKACQTRLSWLYNQIS